MFKYLSISFILFFLGHWSFVLPSPVMRQNHTSSRHVSVIKQWAVVCCINCTPFTKIINLQSQKYLCKMNIGFPLYCFSRFSPLHTCQLILLNGTIHPCLITMQQIIPFCLISCHKVSRRGKTVCFLIFCQELQEPILPILFGNSKHLEWVIGPLPYDNVYSYIPYCKATVTINQFTDHTNMMLVRGRHAWLLFCTDSTVEKLFVPLGSPWKLL